MSNASTLDVMRYSFTYVQSLPDLCNNQIVVSGSQSLTLSDQTSSIREFPYTAYVVLVYIVRIQLTDL
jgi:hypothetical protein